MDQSFEKAYKKYQSCVNQLRSVKRVALKDLSSLYNILCRIKRNREYARLVNEIPGEKKTLETLIESFFEEYNNLYGLEIRDSLIEFEDPELASGSYFIIKSYLNIIVVGNRTAYMLFIYIFTRNLNIFHYIKSP